MDRRRALFLSIVAAVGVLIIATAHEVLLPFVLALLVAYVLTPVVAFVERAHVPRWIAIIVTYAVTLGSFYTFFVIVTPRLTTEVMGLRDEIPALLKTAHEQWVPRLERVLHYGGQTHPGESVHSPDAERAAAARIVPRPDGSYEVHLGAAVNLRRLGDGSLRVEAGEPLPQGVTAPSQVFGEAVTRAVEYARTNAFTLLRFGQALVAAVSRAIFVFFITLMLAAYLMLTRERVYEFFRTLCSPASRLSFDHLMMRMDQGLSGVVRGQLLICIVNGVLSAIGFQLLGLKHGPIFAVLAAIMSVIPIFGSILSAIPAVAIALTQSLATAIAVLAWIVGIHQLEANFLNPKIIGDAAKIHPVLVVFSLVVGEHWFQLPGALLAVPCMSIAQSLFLHFQQIVYGPDAPPDSFRGSRNPL